MSQDSELPSRFSTHHAYFSAEDSPYARNRLGKEKRPGLKATGALYEPDAAGPLDPVYEGSLVIGSASIPSTLVAWVVLQQLGPQHLFFAAPSGFVPALLDFSCTGSFSVFIVLSFSAWDSTLPPPRPRRRFRNSTPQRGTRAAPAVPRYSPHSAGRFFRGGP